MIAAMPPFRALLLLLAMTACGSAAAAAGSTGAQRYQACLRQARSDPGAALAVARAWIADKGGAPAGHCVALALVGLKRYAEAAAKLDELGRAPDVGDLRPSLFDQAGNAWLLAGDAAKASISFQSALTLDAGDPDLYADLARAQALQKDWRDVEADMNAALALAPRRADLLVLRAEARHQSGNLLGAMADAQAAIILKPHDADALVERGAILRDSGQLRRARADFAAALREGAQGTTAETARRNIAALDMAEAQPPKRKPKTPSKGK